MPSNILIHNLNLLLFACLTGCASVPKTEAPVDRAIIVDLSVANDTLIANDRITVSIKNTSKHEICLTNDLLTNPRTYAMDLGVKDVTGRELKELDFGLIPSPVSGEMALSTDDEVEASFNLPERFGFDRLGDRVSQYTVMAQFYFWRCSDRSWLEAKSSWSTFRYPHMKSDTRPTDQ